MNDQKRVCRRCKKKRAEDETPDVAKYKTCAPCRIIERKSKRVKKAVNTGTPIELAEIQLQEDDSRLPELQDATLLCDICGRHRLSNDNGRYKLCALCLIDPTSNLNVESDYAEYLRKLATNKSDDVANLIYYKHLIPPAVPVHAASPEEILAELTQRFIYPISHVTGFQFSRKTSNVLGKQAPIVKALYKCKQDARSKPARDEYDDEPKAVYRSLRTTECQSSVLVSYNLQSMLLVVKYSHKTHSSFLTKNYSNELVAIILEYFANGSTANNILTELQKRAYANDAQLAYGDLAEEIKAIKKATFLRDFSRENILWESHLRSGEFILPMGIDDYPAYTHSNAELAENLAALESADQNGYLSQQQHQLQQNHSVDIGKLVAQYGEFARDELDLKHEMEFARDEIKHEIDELAIDPGLAGLDNSNLTEMGGDIVGLVGLDEGDESLESRLKAGVMAVIDPLIGE
ncbi:hypothetical protein BABINDRAFT_6760 [Babjeviella inositovora NRRL Y-12698]|uniref:Uncharacterized protein n=1 Tax=Babjeviella inositovora NRRL Y-12698 TaxID=984486 RepID=A0A1E3QWU3_9ASCO|nr:uncharacterized protein BABINDRAFT_6760 [Babjeviella inositovora NRRL Y-12698]ODQ82153.1 hypothetical protein BABINDRAFT_6760 [Babjeviella inositovora NRRL Y-12698]